MAHSTEVGIDPVEVALAEMARRVRRAASDREWVTFRLVMKDGRPELLHEEQTFRVSDLTKAA